MFFENDEYEYKLLAPDVDRLLRFFDRGHMNPTASSFVLLSAFKKLSDILTPLAPLKDNDEVKSLWIRIPRGEIEDYGDYEEMKEYGEVETYEEYEKYWEEEYPDEYIWYRLVLVQSFNKERVLDFYAVGLDNKTIISASTDDRMRDFAGGYSEEAAAKLCDLIIPAIMESIELLKAGKYNALVEENLPYKFRTGVIRRSDLWEANPEYKKFDYDNLPEHKVQRFKDMIASGINDAAKIGRIREFTANDFFNACKIGYESIGKECDGYSLSELYMHYADGRDEGLTGKGHGLNEGPGIDFASPSEWDEWYFHREQQGGHPWEVVPGGNSTHVELYVCNDKRSCEWRLRLGEITQEEYDDIISNAGYYFVIAGIHRQFESVSFYIALSEAGLPVVINDAEELVNSFDGVDYVGIVPHHVFPRYCSGMFPKDYGVVFDFMHVYDEEIENFGSKIIWLPEEPAELEEK